MPVYVDTSTLNMVGFCEKAAYLRYHLHRTKPSASDAPLVCGSAVHKVEEARQHGCTPEQGVAILEREYRAWAEANLPGDDARSWTNVSEIVSVWLEMYPVTTQPFPTVPGSVECGIAAALDDHGEIVLVGRLDKLIEAYGAIVVDDFKTTAMNLVGKNKERWEGYYDRAAQGPGYVMMAQATLGQPVVGMQWSVLSLASLPNSASKCKQHNLPYKECRKGHVGFVRVGPRTYGPEERRAWTQAALAQARRWQRVRESEPQAVIETGWYTGKCGECQFRPFCKAGSPWDQLEAMGYVVEKWEPYQHAFGGGEASAKKELPMASEEGPSYT